MTEERITSPQGAAKGSKPQRMDLIPWDAVVATSEVFHFGSVKYDDHNWARGGMRYGLMFAAMQRHLAAWWQGEDDDPESGLCHLQHAAFHALGLLALELRGTGADDRPPTPEELGFTTGIEPEPKDIEGLRLIAYEIEQCTADVTDVHGNLTMQQCVYDEGHDGDHSFA